MQLGYALAFLTRNIFIAKIGVLGYNILPIIFNVEDLKNISIYYFRHYSSKHGNTSRLDKFCQINDTTSRSIDGLKDICIQADVENLSQGAVKLVTSKALNIV